jgi:glycosyltransferase involved in cell wall biosynthesis
MRVLFIVDRRIDAAGVGGAERSLREMLPYFLSEGVEPVVACFHEHGAEVDQTDVPEFPMYDLEGLGRPEQLRKLRRIMLDEHVDLVHTTLFEADVFGRTATLGTRLPVVTSLVNMPYEPARLRHDKNVTPIKLAAVRFLEAATGRLFANHFHAITQAVKDAAVKNWFIPSERVTVVYRGRDERRLGRRTDERRNRVRGALGIPNDSFVILNAARQEYQKGQIVLLDAMERMSSGDDKSLLLIAGRPGNASRELQDFASRSRAKDRIRLLGYRPDVPDLMAASDAFALSSFWEGLGCVLLEALALELPIVASDLPPVREVLDDGKAAVLVPANDASALAQALARVRDDRAYAVSLADRGRRLFESSFTLQHSAEGMMRIFRKTLESGNHRRPVSARTLS